MVRSVWSLEHDGIASPSCAARGKVEIGWETMRDQGVFGLVGQPQDWFAGVMPSPKCSPGIESRSWGLMQRALLLVVPEEQGL